MKESKNQNSILFEQEQLSVIQAITSAKGGVGKTTTCANLGAALAANGKKVLLVDNDPQGDLTKVMGGNPKTQKYTLANLMNAVLDDTDLDFFLEKTVVKTETVHFIPANSRLAGVSNRLVALQISARYQASTATLPCEQVMSKALEPLRRSYDYILIDCGHSMDLLTINALAAATQVIVPVQAHFLAQEDMSDTLDVIKTIQHEINPQLTVSGILLTMYQGRTNLCRSIQEELQATYGDSFVVFSDPIDYSIHVAEHPISAKSIFESDPSNPAARAYSALAREVLSNGQ